MLTMQYCSQCGATVSLRIPDGDNRERYICDSCNTIHYQNPRIIAGCLPFSGDRVLMCKRAIEPRYGLWTLPAGFMENGETVEQAAARETVEEANARVSIGQLFSVISLPHINQVYTLFLGELTDLDFSPGAESLQVELLREQDIPWDELAFDTIRKTLHWYFHDRQQGHLELHVDTLNSRHGRDQP